MKRSISLLNIVLLLSLLVVGCGRAKPQPKAPPAPAALAALAINVTLHPNNADLVVDITNGPEGHCFHLLYATEVITGGSTFSGQSLDLDAHAQTVRVDESKNPGQCAQNSQFPVGGTCRITLPLDAFALAEDICFQAISYSCDCDVGALKDPDCGFQKSNALCWSP